MSEEAKVEVSIEASQKTGAISTAAQEVENLGKKTEEAGQKAREAGAGADVFGQATEGLEAKIGSLLTTAAIAEFFRSAVEESLKEAEALRQVQFAVESTGSSWASMREEVERFAASQQAATRFSDDQTYTALGRLTRVSGDVGNAMRATALAQNIASASGKELGTTTELVANLLAGQERAVVQAQKEFGAFVGSAKTAQDALDALQKGFKNAAQDEESWTKSLAGTTHFLDDFRQRIGDGLVPVLATLARGVAFVAKGYEQLGVIVATAFASAYTAVQGFGAATASVLTGNWKRAVDQANDTKLKLKIIAEEGAKDIDDIDRRFRNKRDQEAKDNRKIVANESIQDEKQAAEERQRINDNLAAKAVESIDGDLAAKKFALDQEVQAARDAGLSKIQFVQEGVDTTISLEEYRAARVKEIEAEATKRIGEEEKKRIEQSKKIEKEKEKLEATRKANFKDTLEYISTLSTAHNKNLAMIGKAAALANAYVNVAQAVTKALASAPPPWNFALAAAVSAAGAAQIATILGVQLKKGGLVRGSAGGVQATIGEEGQDEAVLPLDDSAALKRIGEAQAKAGGLQGGGRYVFNNTFVLPGLEAMRDPAVAREVFSIFAEQISLIPEGKTAALRIAETAERNSGRSS